MAKVVMHYHGIRKINAIKALRAVFNVDLKAAKSLSERGFICNLLQSMAVIGEYMSCSAFASRMTPADAADWIIGSIAPPLEDMSANVPKPRGIANANTPEPDTRPAIHPLHGPYEVGEGYTPSDTLDDIRRRRSIANSIDAEHRLDRLAKDNTLAEGEPYNPPIDYAAVATDAAEVTAARKLPISPHALPNLEKPYNPPIYGENKADDEVYYTPSEEAQRAAEEAQDAKISEEADCSECGHYLCQGDCLARDRLADTNLAKIIANGPHGGGLDALDDDASEFYERRRDARDALESYDPVTNSFEPPTDTKGFLIPGLNEDQSEAVRQTREMEFREEIEDTIVPRVEVTVKRALIKGKDGFMKVNPDAWVRHERGHG